MNKVQHIHKKYQPNCFCHFGMYKFSTWTPEQSYMHTNGELIHSSTAVCKLL